MPGRDRVGAQPRAAPDRDIVGRSANPRGGGHGHRLLRRLRDGVFTLLGLWFIVVQTCHAECRRSAVHRRRAYGVALHFSLAGLMSLLSLVDPASTALWRISLRSSPPGASWPWPWCEVRRQPGWGRAGRRPRRACNGCLQHRLRLVPAAHAAAPSFHPGPRGAASLGGLSPADPSSPTPPISPLGGPVHGSCPEPGMGKRRARQVRKSNHLAGSSSGHTGSHPARCHRSVGRESAAARPVGRPPQL